MKTINQPLTSPEDKTSKTTLFFTALALAALMVSATVGGAAFIIYHEFSAMPEGAQASHGPQTVRLANSYAQADAVPTGPGGSRREPRTARITGMPTTRFSLRLKPGGSSRPGPRIPCFPGCRLLWRRRMTSWLPTPVTAPL